MKWKTIGASSNGKMLLFWGDENRMWNSDFGSLFSSSWFFFFGLLRISLFIYFPRKITKAISPHLHTWKISKTQNFFPKMVFNRIIMLFKFLYVFICLARFENFVFGYMFDYIHCQHSFYRTINAAFELETLKPHLRYDQKSKCT